MSKPAKTDSPNEADSSHHPQVNAASVHGNVAAGQNQSPAKKTVDDFVFGKQIGEGSFSTVYVATDAQTRKREYAIKVCEKSQIRKEKKHAAILREKEIMNILNQHSSPFFIKLLATFQDTNRLFFVMNYAKGGELLQYLNKAGHFEEVRVRFYAAEILLALEHMHHLGVIHRDLKPENILLLTEHGHIQVSDFGSAVVDKEDGSGDAGSPLNRRNSFVGTAQYVSPEMLTDKYATRASDVWALGCILYQLAAGTPPFRAPNEYLIFQKIIKLEYEYPEDFPSSVKQLVSQLLLLEPNQRLGIISFNNGMYMEIRNNEFFKPMEGRWSTLHTEIPPYSTNSSETPNAIASSTYTVPPDIEPGLDEKQMTRLLGLALYDDDSSAKPPVRETQEFNELITKQTQNNPWHRFVNGHLILKQGLVDKRKQRFYIARRRMFLLTTGPRIFYVDPVNMVLKGEIPWTETLRPEAKNFKTFYVHTPNRCYYLEDPEGDAPSWCKFIEDVHRATYAKSKTTPPATTVTTKSKTTSSSR